MNENDRYEAARKRVKQIKEFYSHLASYVVVIGALALIDVLDGRFDWFWWAAIPWGIGLAIHAFTVWGENGIFGQEWEERKMRELLGEKPKRTLRGDYEDMPVDADELPLPPIEEARRRRHSG